jgi:hypothetical protein
VRLILLATSALCFLGATACFAVGFVGVARLVVAMPPVEEGLAKIASLQAWLWWFLGLAAAGFAILWFVPDRAGKQETGPGDGGRTPGAHG